MNLWWDSTSSQSLSGLSVSMWLRAQGLGLMRREGEVKYQLEASEDSHSPK